MIRKNTDGSSNPFDFLFDEISKILKMIQNGELNTELEKLPPNFDKRLDELQKKVIKFGRISEDIVKLSGVSDEEMKLRIEGTSKEIPEEGKRLIQRSKEIKSEAERLNEKLEKELHKLSSSDRKFAAQADSPEDKVITNENYAKKRRSKFKRFGSDNKWKPL